MRASERFVVAASWHLLELSRTAGIPPFPPAPAPRSDDDSRVLLTSPSLESRPSCSTVLLVFSRRNNNNNTTTSSSSSSSSGDKHNKQADYHHPPLIFISAEPHDQQEASVCPPSASYISSRCRDQLLRLYLSAAEYGDEDAAPRGLPLRIERSCPGS